jgi:adenosylcobyric acid synthase
VLRLPRISNFTDVDALGLEPGVEVRWVSDARELSDVDLVVLPGTRATIADLAWMRVRGLDRAVLAHASTGRAVLGICGGFQMLGHTISDPPGVEGRAGVEVQGLGLLDVSTAFDADKVLRRHADGSYEIHHGRIDGAHESGWTRSGPVSGTMRHGSLESDATRSELLAQVAEAAGRTWRPSGVSFAVAREARLDLLGDLAEKHLDIDALLALAHDGVPSFPLLHPGAAS